VGAIEPKLRSAEIERAIRKPTDSLDAYDLYLRALGKVHKFTDEDAREAIGLLKQALTIDPSYAPAAAMIGCCRVWQKIQDWGPVSEGEIAEAVRLARGAIEAGKDDPDALWMGGWAVASLSGDKATGESAVDRALLVNPNSAYAWMARGWLSYLQNRPSPSIEAFEHAIQLSPLDPLGYFCTCGLAFGHTIAGRREEAIQWVDRSLREMPRYRAAVNLKVILCAQLDRVDEAREWLDRLLEIVPGLTIAAYRAFLVTALPPELLARYVEAMRKAGLPEE
jgi:tetratricopeptide (TPR) repeat protein